MDKVVLARAQSFVAAPDCHFDVAATAKALRERQTEATTFLVQRTDGQAFLGSTPEILVRLTGRTVETVAMAGTRKRGETAESDALSKDLLASPKDRHEQALVTEALRQALAPVVVNLKVPDAPDVVQFPDVQHLRTAITGTLLNGIELFGLLDRLHPTPAVGGLPRAEALAWLDDHEGLDRGWYAGPIGWTNQAGDGAFVVAIRSALMTEREAAAFAGCGVVAHSNPRDEWDESVVKLQTVRSGLALRANSVQEPNKT
jgi:isochorismate synthase